MSSPAATFTAAAAIVEEAPTTNLTAVEKSSTLDDEEEDHDLCWEGFMSPVEDDASGDVIFQLVVDGATFGSRLIVSENVPEMGEYVCSLPYRWQQICPLQRSFHPHIGLMR